MIPEDARSVRFRLGPPSVVDLLDQTKLPGELTRLLCTDGEMLHDAITRLVVRGAPAIGVAAAYGVLLTKVDPDMSAETVRRRYRETIALLATSRPTAVNLFWALDRMTDVIESADGLNVTALRDRLHAEAVAIDTEDVDMCHRIGRWGSEVLKPHRNILTHCNAGSLATSLRGTALSPLYQLHESGHRLHVFADETRPLMQGARLTAWELHQAGIPVTVCTDSMAGSLMRAGQIDAVIVGADRIASNGDAANKIGTYPLAVLARHHGLPFYVAAPTSTLDLGIPDGDAIPIEMRDASEVTHPVGHHLAMVPEGVAVTNPAFDVTPAELITALITELGVIHEPDRESIARQNPGRSAGTGPNVSAASG
ncbi:MAG: S-methyl-5-thioribose-1-phosphate isomerase [Planctomycetota bacterium]